MIDLHAHVLPGLDDGPADEAEALDLCRAAVACGTRTLVATPHMLDGVFDAARGAVLDAVSALQRRLLHEEVPLRVLPGGEVRIAEDLLERLGKDEVLTLGDGGRYLLLELPPGFIPHGIERFLRRLDRSGVKAVIAHAERNAQVQQDPRCLVEIVREGHLVQVTAASLTGELGAAERRCARALLEADLCHVVASDCHPGIRSPDLRPARTVVQDLLGREETEKIFEGNPEKILTGRKVGTIRRFRV